jgi:ABC-2 type transport system ATP-binding protein
VTIGEIHSLTAVDRQAAPERGSDRPGQNGDVALAFDHVTKRFGKGTLALDDVSWAIRSGARVCLLGPNGAGKSTCIRLLQGVLQPTAGQVALLGAPVGGPAYREARARTGIVPQAPGMYRDLTTAEYLELARRLYGGGDVPRLIEALGLGPYADRFLAELSGGYQRRVSLAAALLGEPQLLLLDEPTAGLDPVATREVHDILREAMRGRTTLLCTHNLAEAEALCDEVVILQTGRVLVHEPLANLRRRSRPRLRLAARQGDAALAATLRRRGLDGEPTGDDGEGLVVPLDRPSENAPALLRALLADGLDVFVCAPIEATLEELFLDVVGGGR